MGAPVVDINITRGKTFEFLFRYADHDLVYRPILAMPSTAPVRLTITNHDIPDGWPIRIEGVRQPYELNTEDDCYHIATTIDTNTIELNTLRADEWRPYAASGNVVFNRPFDLAGCSARMQIRNRVDGEVLLKLSSDATTLPDGLISIDTSLSALTVRLSPAITTAITWTRGVYDLELITSDGNVYPITDVSRVTVVPEVTR